MELAELMSKANTSQQDLKSSIYSEALRLVSSLQTEDTCKDALLNIANYIELTNSERES